MSPIDDGRTRADTLAKLFLVCERKHLRDAVVQWREGGPEGEAWVAMPDWRFDRQVLRFASYLKERAGAREGGRLLIHAPACVETLVASWSALLLGLSVGAIDARVESDTACSLARSFVPQIALVSSATRGALAPLDGVACIVLGERGENGESTSASPVSWGDALDLGGTLDTAERAQALRAGARALSPMLGALAWHRGTNGKAEWPTLSQGEVVERVRRLWADVPPRPGAKRYVDPANVDLAARLALIAAIADGVTCAALGPPDPPVVPIAVPKKRRWFAIPRLADALNEERRS